MRALRKAFALAAAAVIAGGAILDYDAPTDRKLRPKPPLPELGAAGTVIPDPTFGTRILRATDGRTYPDRPGPSCSSPAASLQSAWSADSTRFIVICGGFVLPMRFDPERFSASRMGSRRDLHGGMYLDLNASASFSFSDPDLIYGAGAGLDGSNTRRLLEYNFRTRKYRTLLDLDRVVRGAPGAAGPVSVSANERLVVAFGGRQDTWRYIVVFDKNSGSRKLLDTRESVLEGKPAGFEMGWGVHLVNIDKSGRYVIISKGQGSKMPNLVVWDTKTDEFAHVEPEGGGHYAAGYGYLVNGVSWWPSWGQWLLRPLDTARLGETRRLVVPDLPEDSGGRQEHSSWANARADAWAPVFVSITRNFNAKNPPSPWEDEIVAVSADPDRPVVWRFAHHRSVLDRTDFWDTPRGNISPDGRFFLFTSNWEKTLGETRQGRPRQDSFVLELPVRR